MNRSSAQPTTIATIDQTGTVTSLGIGTTTITAASTSDPSKSDSIILTVTEANAVVSVTIDGGDRSLALGDTLTLTATVVTTGDANDTVAWSTGNASVATISQTGSITSLSMGATIITATSTTATSTTATSTSDAGKSANIILTVDPPGTLAWTRQFGTDKTDDATAIATDANGNVYAAGATLGALSGDTAGGRDAFIRSYDRDGNHRWTRQCGTTSSETAIGAATDANGNVHVTGDTRGDLEGRNFGGTDAFIRKYGP